MPASFKEQFHKVETAAGFIAALDQSGGSTPKALKQYGVSENEYSNDDEMFACIHAMRTRIVTSPSFRGDRILGAILFENTMRREIEGLGSARFLWQKKAVVPFLKVDKGLAAEQDGVQLMKPIPDLDTLLQSARECDVFGTKMRSVIKHSNEAGVKAIVDQQFDIGLQILASGLIPILEPEVDIHSPTKAEAEQQLLQAILERANRLASDQKIMLKLTLPSEDGFYSGLINDHPGILRVVALSGGYTREAANAKLASNPGMIASFSRALAEGLSKQQSDADFNATLENSIESIFEASKT